MKILGISGSIRVGSYNISMLETAKGLLSGDHTMTIYKLDRLPLYNDELAAAKPPQTVIDFRKHIENADGLLIASPEYNYSITGVLKNALDWAATDTLGNLLKNKTIAILGASRTIFGTVRAQLHLRQILLAASANVIQKPEVYIRRVQDLQIENGVVQDERTRTKISALLSALLMEIGENK